MACYIVKMQKNINMRLTIFVTDMKHYVRQNHFGTSLKNRSSLFFLVHTNSKITLLGQL